MTQNVPSKLSSSLFLQKEGQKYCDLTLKFGAVELKAHACVVVSFSPFVDKWMSFGEVMPPLSDICQVPLSVNRFSCIDCARKVIDFMYLGKIQIDDDHLEHIQVMSEALQVSELLYVCRKHLGKNCARNKEGSEKRLSRSCSDAEENIKISEEEVYLSQATLKESVGDQVTDVTPIIASPPATFCDDAIDESEWGGVKCPKCPKCDLVFVSLAKYQQHCSSHLGKTFTTCYVCNYASIRVSDVIKHLQEKNHGEKVCSICLLEVSSNENLKDHLQVHDQSQPFICLTCNSQFQTRTALNSHIVRHTSETPFECKECKRGFKWKHSLRNHMVTHSKLKSFLCDECGFSTAHLRSFIDHKTIHSGEKFKCPKPDCQFTSVRKESVKHHLMTHSKEKPYQCEVCGQAFSQSKNLRRHAASHNPLADPEKCPFCSYQTNRSDKFKAHFKRYHKDGEKTEVHWRNRRKSTQSTNISQENNEQDLKTAMDSCKNLSEVEVASVWEENSTALLSKNKAPGKGHLLRCSKKIPRAAKKCSGKNPLPKVSSVIEPFYISNNEILECISNQVLINSSVNVSFIDGLISVPFKSKSSKSLSKISKETGESNQQNKCIDIKAVLDDSLVIHQFFLDQTSQTKDTNENSSVISHGNRNVDCNQNDSCPTNENMILLEAEEITTSTSDSVYIIPDGSFVIMDEDASNLQTIQH